MHYVFTIAIIYDRNAEFTETLERNVKYDGFSTDFTIEMNYKWNF